MTENLSAYANFELGEAFFEILKSMIIADGIPFPKAEDFDFVSNSWKKLANKENKSQGDIKKLDEDYKIELCDLADSCILYMSAKTGNKSYKFSIEDYKKFLSLTDMASIPLDNSELADYNKKIEIQFKKIANHGEDTGDDLIDRKDFAAYIYALDLCVERNDKDELAGFTLNGRISALNYAIAYRQLKEDGDNMFSFKLRQGYKNLFGE